MHINNNAVFIQQPYCNKPGGYIVIVIHTRKTILACAMLKYILQFLKHFETVFIISYNISVMFKYDFNI